MSLKRNLIIVSVILLFIVAGVGVMGVIFYRSYLAPLFAMREVPSALSESRILTGADFLTKSEFYRTDKDSSLMDVLEEDKAANRFESIRDMSIGQFDGQPGLDLGLAGMFGMTILDLNGQVKERVEYQFEKGKIEVAGFKMERPKDSFPQMRVLDVEGDGVCEILGFGGTDGAALFDHQGRVRFSRGTSQEGQPSIREVTAGDLDADGKLEFVAGWGYDPSSIELFDRDGRSLWRHEEEFISDSTEVVDVDADGRDEIVETYGSELKIRDAQGKLKGSATMPLSLNYLSLCPRPDGRGASQILVVEEGKVVLLDLDGKNFSSFEAPLSKIKLDKPREVKFPGMDEPFVYETEEVYRASGVWAKLQKDQPKYLAVVARFAAIDRSLFYVYDAQGKLLYHEILPEDCNSVAVLPSAREDGGEDILVGGEKTIWRYAAH
ncbi:MAG TPA: hypothetical protein VGW12_20910 [Pyrinomonadaceae bacterium]|nr:hypothetical protein [Pyrinomonadaceae bacterium]